MMTVPMDNLAAPTSRELVQRLHKKNIEFENRRRKSAQAKIPSDPNAWQQARENYEAIILEDHAFSEQHGIEYALWQLHYKRIEELRAHFSAALAPAGSATSQGVKGPVRLDRIKRIRSQLKAFLSEATGFYHDLFLKIRAKYGLPLGYFSEDPDNQITMAKDGKKSSEMKKGLMSCHRCLIYLGDLARYKGLYGEGDSKNLDYAAASSYYMQAASLWPSSGNPHHQLAILATYSGDDLVAVYRYFRSLAVNTPFTTTRDNLIIAFEKNRQSYSLLPGDTKASSAKIVPVQKTGKGRGRGEGETMLLPKNGKLEATPIEERAQSIPETYKAFCIRFVRLNGILFTRTSLETFGEVFSLVSSNLCELLSSGPEEELNFCSDAAENGLVIVRLVAVLIFTVHNVNRETEGHSYAEILQRSVLLQNAFTAAFQLVGHIVKRCMQLHDPSSSYLLPGILVFVEWLACRPDIAVGSEMEEKQATARSFFWNHCISFLNKLMSCRFAFVDGDEDETCFFNMSRYDEGETGNRLALWEDFELRGFFPLLPAQQVLDFSRKHSTGSDGGNMEKRARIHRIVAAGRALANVVRIDQQVIYFDQKRRNFAIGVEPPLSEDFVLASSSEMPLSIINPVEKTGNLGVLQSKAYLHTEGEEEDEEIVFKPTVAEKLGDAPSPNLTTYEVLGPGENTTSKDEWASYAGFISAPLSNIGPQNALDASMQSHVSFANMIPQQHMQPINSGASRMLLEQQAYLLNGMKNLGVGNGLSLKSEFQEGLRSSQPPVFSLPFPQSTNLSTDHMFYSHREVPEAVIPSKFDSIVHSGANSESLIVNPSVTLAATSRKNPVSRPVRHLGPPPGFSSIPPKPADEIMVGSNLKNENPPLDDYSWLDGYQLSSATKGVTPNKSINHTTHVYPHVMNNSNNLTGTISFPFPGKQVPAMQVNIENQNSWQDAKLLEHMKLYREQHQQQQQLQQAQQSAPLLEQYQGQSEWSDHFFV